jgi:hypothetical protein
LTKRPGGAVLGWCALYTLSAPEGERERRRGEIAAHVWDAIDHSGTGLRARARLGLDSARGLVDDLVWCSEVRRSYGMRGLLLEAFVGPVGATTIAGFAMVAAFAFSLTDVGLFPSMRQSAVTLAAVVMGCSMADRLWRRWRSRRMP